MATAGFAALIGPYRLQLDDALFFSGDARRLWITDETTGFITAGEEREYLLEVEAGEPLVVVLTWTDPPSNPAASIHLINDLDLELDGPSGTFRGNVFASGVSTSGGDFDRLNPVEQIRIESPVAGTYTLRVSAFALPTAGQPFALVAVGAVAAATDLFADGFEDGTLDAWAISVGAP